MTHKISPIAFRLGISSSWLSSYHIAGNQNLPLILHSDKLIRKIVQGVLLQYSIFTSPIIIKRNPCGALAIHLFFWDASSPSLSAAPSLFNNFPLKLRSYQFKYILDQKRNKRSKIQIISNLVYILLSKLYGTSSITLHFSEIPSPVLNAKILCDYLAFRISLNPYYHKSVVMEALRASKTTTIN